MKKIAFLFLLFSITIQAQVKVSGVVLDEQNQPLPFVNVYLKKTTIGTVTDEQGRFKLTSSKKRGKIEASFIGYKTKSFKFNLRKKYFKIILKEDSNTLDEVIIVTKPKKRLKKKENPAYKVLKEIWKRKKSNGLY